MRTLALMTVLASLLVQACEASAQSDVCAGRLAGDLVITELMIDPEGPDTGEEWIELFNPRSAPLELKELTLFASDVDGAKLATHVLKAGAVPAHGYFVVGDVRARANPEWIDYAYSADLGALGNSRGLVGLRCGTTLLDEVRWTAPASPGRSRMLGGTGGPLTTPDAVKNDDDANWCDTPLGLTTLAPNFAPNSGTPGQPNPSCQTAPSGSTCLEGGALRALAPPGPGDLIITEVMTSPSGADATREWLEVLARADVDLNRLTIGNGSGATATIDSPSCLRVPRGAYALLSRSPDAFVNGDLPAPAAVYSLSLSNSNERVVLRHRDAGVDQVVLLPSTSGEAWQLDPSRLEPSSVDDPSRFCHAPRPWHADGSGDFGSPGAPNPPCASGTGRVDAGLRLEGSADCIDPQTRRLRPLRRPTLGDLVITEWMPNPSAVTDALGEYFEIRVNTDIDLNDLVLGDASSETRTLSSPDCLPAAAGSYHVFAATADTSANGGLPKVTGVVPFGLGNTTDSIWVRGLDGGLLDSVSYSTSAPGQATQLTRGLTRPADNDVASNLCFTPDASRNRYGADDLGTPGRANVACP